MSFSLDADGTVDVVYLEDGVLICTDGRIDALMPATDYAADGGDLDACEDLRPCFICPGFVDTHLHMPQLGIIASYSPQLLDWLDRFAFPAEQAFADSAFAAEQAQHFLDRVIASGTTCAQVFTTVHEHACEHLFAAAQSADMAMVAGKVMMDRHAPAPLTQEPQACARACEGLINRWHDKGRLRYALTPRFAITSSEEQLALCGELLQSHPSVLLQTHLSENHEEIGEVARLFPQADDYLDVYERFGLNVSSATFAHGIHLSASASASASSRLEPRWRSALAPICFWAVVCSILLPCRWTICRLPVMWVAAQVCRCFIPAPRATKWAKRGVTKCTRRRLFMRSRQVTPNHWVWRMISVSCDRATQQISWC